MKTCEQIAAGLVDPGRHRAHAPIRLLLVEGPDAVDFLHRLSSQDIADLPVGGCSLAAFLDAKGKLLFAVAVARFGPERLGLEVAAVHADALYERLDRYHFTERLTLTLTDEPCGEWVRLAADDVAGCEESEGQRTWQWVRGGVVFGRVQAGADWFGGNRWFGNAAEELSAETAEALRIATGRVAVGVDTEASTLGMEANLEDHISFDKGCYTGQEIVARIQTYGHVNRRLVALAGAVVSEPELGTPLCEPEEGDPVGRWMTSALLPDGQRIALGYLPRDFWAPGTVLRLGELSGPQIHVVGFEGP